ncbi:CCA tRNA nucleotidyltransferase [Candidatus Gottesmanbacteria bacterium]|nr:CCA tRNA nucleotidyltransferase [Candidatus Gottesmanbacteria bacterium]
MIYILPKEAQKLMIKIRKAGFQVFAVGGCVRDIIMGRETNDWDFTTNADPSQIQSLFPEGFYDNKFGTVGVPIEKSKVKNLSQAQSQDQKSMVIYEITTFRSEFGYSDHRHPDKIAWGKTLEEDLQRRDFTINAMAFDGKKIIDLFGGQKDLNNHLIKAVGDPSIRFSEDALRMMRAIRIATELHFLIEEKTFNAIKQNVLLIKKISSERIRDELLKILSSDYPVDGIKLLRNAGLLSTVLPELEKCFGVEQKSPGRHHIYDVGTHSILSLKSCPSTDPIVRLATLLHDVGKPPTFKKENGWLITFFNHEIIAASIVRNIADRLHFPKKDRERLITLVRWHQFTVDERQTDSALRRFIRRVGKENLEDMLALRVGDRLGGGARETSWRLEEFKKRLVEVQKQPFTVSDLKVDGYDVMEKLNIRPGPMVGKVLNILFTEVTEAGKKNERKYLLKKIKDLGKKLTELPDRR